MANPVRKVDLCRRISKGTFKSRNDLRVAQSLVDSPREQM